MSSKYWTGASADGNWSTAGNWTPSAPASGDDVYFQNSSVSVTAGLAQSAVLLNSLNIDQSFLGEIGTASAYLQIGTQTSKLINIGAPAQSGSGAGSQRIKLDLGSVAGITLNVLNSNSSSSDTNLPAIQVKGTGGTFTVNASGGNLGLAVGLNETTTLTTLNVSNVNGSTATQVTLGAGCTVTTIKSSGGTVTNLSTAASTTFTLNGGTILNYSNGALTTVNCYKSAIFKQFGNGTITTLNTYGTSDFSGDPRAKTVTNCNLYPGGCLNLDTGVTKSVTLTNGIILTGADFPDCTIKLGKGFTATIS